MQIRLFCYGVCRIMYLLFQCSHVAKVLQSAEQLRKEILDPNECKKAICNKPFIIAMHIAKKTNNRVCDVCRYAENMLVKRFQNLDKIMEMSLSEVDKICDMIPYSRLSSRVMFFPLGCLDSPSLC